MSLRRSCRTCPHQFDVSKLVGQVVEAELLVMDDADGCACVLPKEVVEECQAVSVMAVSEHLHRCLDGSSKRFPQGNTH
eukprot:13082017-Ditylum_brightwellii.AAC.1